MRTQLSVVQPAYRAIRGNQPMNRQRHDEGMKTPSRFGWIVLILVTLMLLIPATAISKGGKGKGGGETPPELVDYGDVFGDLRHILRDPDTGQPIFAQRWIEMPAELPGYGWGYCAIAVDEYGARLGFEPYSCDILAADADRIVEVDYFGRLNGSRVQERNQRMHFNETITNIKQAVRLRLDPTGRLALGFTDPDLLETDPTCAANEAYCVWATVDSPMENMALYQRFMKYGHIATDPEELDLWWHGSPELPTPFHPALDADDFAKFESAGLDNWLPDGNCWAGSAFKLDCAEPEDLTAEDFDTSADLLGAAGGKHNFFTADLVQYLNRFLRITQSTEFAAATNKQLPAQYEQCECFFDDDPWTSGEEAPEGWDLDTDLTYENCVVSDVDENIENYKDFSNVQERFMDFAASDYDREYIWDDRKATVALEALLVIPTSDLTAMRVQAAGEPSVESTPGAISDIWLTVEEEPLVEWIILVNPDYGLNGAQIHNFVDAASDTLRAIEFFHNYAIPENLFCTYELDGYCVPPEAVTNQ